MGAAAGGDADTNRRVDHEDEFQAEFLNALRPGLVDRMPPDLWTLHWALVTPQRRDIAISLIAGRRERRGRLDRARPLRTPGT